MEGNTGSTWSFRWSSVVQDPKIMLCTIKSRNDMKAVESMEIKAFIFSKSTYSLIKWPQLISQLKFSKLRPNFCN